VIDPSEARQSVDRFRTLSDLGNELIDGLGGAGLSSDTLRWQSETRWILAVHELIKPEVHLVDEPRVTVEWTRELWLASAAAIGELAARPVSENSARDRFCYDEWCKGTNCKAIKAAVNVHPAWDPLETIGGIKTAASRYADRMDLPPIPKRRAGRPTKRTRRRS